MKILNPLKNFRQNIANTRYAVNNRTRWAYLWSRASVELRLELASQIAASQFAAKGNMTVCIDDPLLIAELVTIDAGIVDIHGEPVTFNSVNESVILGLVSQAADELRCAPEVRHAIEVEALRKAEEIAPELERVVRDSWSSHIKVRTRSRFLIEGFVQIPEVGTALNVLILESSGHTSRELLRVERKTAQAIRMVTDKFEKFPTIVLALGAKVEREVWVVPQHAVELAAVTHRL
jgi:hypothetical protein